MNLFEAVKQMCIRDSNPIIPHWNGSETTVLPNGKDEIKLADGKAVYVEDNYMSVI